MFAFDDDTHSQVAETAEATRPKKSPWRWVKRIAVGLVGLVALLVFLGFMLYNFGTMERPSDEQYAQFQQAVAQGRAVDMPKALLRIPIPGCKCHHDDPVVAVQHSQTPIRDCSKCHGGS